MRLHDRLVRLALASVLVGALALTGCTLRPEGRPGDTTSAETEQTSTAPIKIGTLATQDALPLWVAEEKDYFADNGLNDVEIVIFQSAQESQAAFTAGAVDALMTDVMVSANLHASGTEVVIPTVMLGATIPEGRFAVVGAPKTNFASMQDLKGVPVGIGSVTITEYVFDKLAEEGGLDPADVKKEEVKKMPVRFQLLMSGQLKAASLPEPFVTLAEQGGAKIVPGGDDTKAKENISQSVLAVNREYASGEGEASVEAVLKAWDAAVADINADPNAYRQTLVDKARLPAPLATSYPVSTYPTAAAPEAQRVQAVLDWMKDSGYLKTEVTPEDLIGK